MAGGAFALALMSTVLGPRGTRTERLLASRPFTWIGERSYSLYLLHYSILTFLIGHTPLIRAIPSTFVPDAVILLAVSLAVASVAYHVVERPAMRFRWRTVSSLTLQTSGSEGEMLTRGD